MKLGGTLTFGNKPGLALGRIESRKLGLALSSSSHLTAYSTQDPCGSLLRMDRDVQTGVGFVFSTQIESDIRAVRLEGWGLAARAVALHVAGSSDFVARLSLDAGWRRRSSASCSFGISVSLLAEWLAHEPDYFVFRATFRIETPWFLPDVSFTVEVVDGSLEPEARGVLTSPLLAVSGTARQSLAKAEVNRLDGLAGTETPALFTLNALPGSGAAWRGEATPLPLHGQLEIRFSPMMADALGLGSVAVDADLGVQSTGDDDVELKARYMLTGLEIKRRPITGGSWQSVERITSSADARKFRWAWDTDTRTGGRLAPKKLLLNGNTPFTVGYANPTADAEILTEHPNFPCCEGRQPDVARFDFCDDALGAVPGGVARAMFWLRRSGSAPIRVRGGAYVVVAPMHTGAACARVASFALAPAPVISLTAEEDLARAALSYAASGRKLDLTVVARNSEGDVVYRHVDSISGGSAFKVLTVAPGRAFRSLEVFLSAVSEKQGGNKTEALLVHKAFVLDWIECITSEDERQAQVDEDRCNRTGTAGNGEVVPFLPRHQYEVSITTEIAVRHTETDWATRTVTENVRFQTSGPPGLNETKAPGQELVPYVENADAGGRGLLYREESVHLVLSSDLKVFGPGLPGSDEFGYRLPVTLTVATAFDTNSERGPTKSSYESREWFLDRHASILPRVAVSLKDPVFALTKDELKLRLRDLVEASFGTCPPDDVWNETRPRLGVEPFDARGRPLWEPRTRYRAAMRIEGSPVVERNPFVPADLSTFLSSTGSWSVTGDRLVATGDATAQFGETDWDYLHLELVADLNSGKKLSAAVLVDAANEGGGLRFVLSRGAGASGTLEARPVSGGAALTSVSLSELGDTVNLQIDAFADTIRASAGGQTLRIDRGARGGGLCEIGARDASIRSLSLRGIEMVGFDFTTSRYVSFEDHIASAGAAGHVLVGAGAEPLQPSSPAFRARSTPPWPRRTQTQNANVCSMKRPRRSLSRYAKRPRSCTWMSRRMAPIAG